MAEHRFEPGCYIDGNNGHFVTVMVIKFAQTWGYLVDPFIEYALAHYHRDSHEASYPNDALHDVSDEAIEHMAANHGVEGYWWGHNDGDFGLWPMEVE